MIEQILVKREKTKYFANKNVKWRTEKTEKFMKRVTEEINTIAKTNKIINVSYMGGNAFIIYEVMK